MRENKINLDKLIVLFSLLFILSPILVSSQEAPDTFKNPILSGYHPDPSICTTEMGVVDL